MERVRDAGEVENGDGDAEEEEEVAEAGGGGPPCRELRWLWRGPRGRAVDTGSSDCCPATTCCREDAGCICCCDRGWLWFSDSEAEMDDAMSSAGVAGTVPSLEGDWDWFSREPEEEEAGEGAADEETAGANMGAPPAEDGEEEDEPEVVVGDGARVDAGCGWLSGIRRGVPRSACGSRGMSRETSGDDGISPDSGSAVESAGRRLGDHHGLLRGGELRFSGLAPPFCDGRGDSGCTCWSPEGVCCW